MDNSNAGVDRIFDMKLNSTLIRKLREERAWSQEHLAEVAGLGIRTIQRVESDGNASHETRLALANAFEVNVTELSLVQPVPETPHDLPVSPVEPDLGSKRRKRGGWSILRLGVVAVFLILIDLFLNGRMVWSHWPALGLGIGAGVMALKRGLLPRPVFWGVIGLGGGIVVLLAVARGELRWLLWIPLIWGFVFTMRWLRRKERG